MAPAAGSETFTELDEKYLGYFVTRMVKERASRNKIVGELDRMYQAALRLDGPVAESDLLVIPDNLIFFHDVIDCRGLTYEQLRFIMDRSWMMAHLTGPDRQCMYLNQAVADYFGVPASRLMGFGWKQFIHPDDLERCLGVFIRAFDERQPFRNHYRLLSGDRGYRWVVGKGEPWYLADGTFAGYVGSMIELRTESSCADGPPPTTPDPQSSDPSGKGQKLPGSQLSRSSQAA